MCFSWSGCGGIIILEIIYRLFGWQKIKPHGLSVGFYFLYLCFLKNVILLWAMLNFQPKPGSVVYCDYKGFIEPEMVKKRPVIVISKHKHNKKLISIVPISTTKPDPMLDYHIQMDPLFCSIYLENKKSWIKCDMINVVCLERLHLVRDSKTGIRSSPEINTELLLLIKEAVKKAHRL